MTAYLLTEQEHKQLLDMLAYSHLGAYTMLKAMKPQTPAAWRTIESDEKNPIRLDEWFYASNPDYVKVHKYKWVPLYASGDTA